MSGALSLMLGPILGGIIGYITNEVAIRMLFRPKKAKYVFHHRVPFTPGLIHKEKGRIAASLGKAVSDHLLSPEVLEKNLLDDNLVQKIRLTINDFFAELAATNVTLREYLSRYLSEQELASISSGIVNKVTDQLSKTLKDSDLGGKIAHLAIEHIMKKTKDGLLGKFGADLILSAIGGVVESLLASNINDIIANHSDDIVASLARDGIDSLMSRRVSDLLSGHEGDLQKVTDYIVKVYRTVVTNHLPRMLATVNISAMVERRVAEMDAMQIEDLIFTVMKKELRAIVWLGALLGVLMGSVNTVLALI